jgi:hypothetical protein
VEVEGLGLLDFVDFGVGFGLLFGVDLGVDFAVELVELVPADEVGFGLALPDFWGFGFDDDVGRGAAVGLPEGGRSAEPEAAGEELGSVTVDPEPADGSGSVDARAAVPQAVAARAPAAATAVPPLTRRQPRARRSAADEGGTT